jgi:hypothetical protein
MLRTLFYVGLQLAISLLIARPAGVVLSLAGAPGVSIAHRFRTNILMFRFGLLLATVAELYLVLAFAAALILWTRSLVAANLNLNTWLLKGSCFVASILPPWIVWLSTIDEIEDDRPTVEPFLRPYLTIERTAKVAPLGVLVIALFPSVLAGGWGWLSTLHL